MNCTKLSQPYLTFLPLPSRVVATWKMNHVIHNLASYRDHSTNNFFVLIDQNKVFDRVNNDYLCEQWIQLMVL